MREIIFRGKKLGNGDWVYGYYVRVGDAHFIMTGKTIEQNHLNDFGYPCHRLEREAVDPATVGQYTGMTDKNGQKIFEDDIIQTPKYGIDNGKGQNFSGNDTFVVGYADGTYTLENRLRRFYLRPDKTVEIIGNCWDNPEQYGIII